MDYIQLHQDDLGEFYQLSNNLLTRLNDDQIRTETMNAEQLRIYHDDLEKSYEQVELLNHKGELLLQSSATNTSSDNDNQIERLLENINRNYDSLNMKTKFRIQQNDSQPLPMVNEQPASVI
jgi:hypothetical protein